MITSPQNPRIKHIKALLARKKDRQEQRLFVIEGLRLVQDACIAGVVPRTVLAAPGLPPQGEKLVLECYRRGAQVDEVTWNVLQVLTDTENSQGILAVVPFLEAPVPARLTFAVLADTIRDPGNLGSILRSAAAAGAQAAFLSPACVDAYNPKVVRAGMGAHFRLPIFQMDWSEIRQVLKDRPGSPPLSVLEAESSGKRWYWTVDLTRPVCIMVSNEAEGTSLKGLELSDAAVSIPMPGKTESLNAAMAASILMFEVIRQRWHS